LIQEEETMQMMKDNGVWLSAQPILNDEDGLKFENPISTAKFKQVTDGTAEKVQIVCKLRISMR